MGTKRNNGCGKGEGKWYRGLGGMENVFLPMPISQPIRRRNAW